MVNQQFIQNMKSNIPFDPDKLLIIEKHYYKKYKINLYNIGCPISFDKIIMHILVF